MKKIIKKLQRGFTIVELVIVIAVIAILAAVLIPTFANLINSAEESNDMVLVSNINTIVTSYDTVGEIDKVTTQDESGDNVSVYNIATAIKAVSENGYDVSKLTPTSESGDIVYNASTNNFLYYTDDFTELAYGTEPKAGEVLVVVDSNLQRVALAQSSSLLSGLTVQYCVYTTYDTGANVDNSDITVWLYTEGGSVTINLAGGTVYHYGVAETVAIKEVASKSYHLYGAVEEITLDKGHVELAESAVCTTVTSTSETGMIITVVGEKSNLNLVGTFATYYTKTSDTETSTEKTKEEFATASGVILEGTAASNPYKLSTADEVVAMCNNLTAGSTWYFALASDIDMNDSTGTHYSIIKNVGAIELDLNGYKIKAASDSHVFQLNSSANFTITDSTADENGANGSGAIYATGTTTASQIILLKTLNPTLTLESGNIYATNCSGLTTIINLDGTTNDGAKFIMNGGSIYAENSTITNSLINLINKVTFTMNGGSVTSGETVAASESGYTPTVAVYGAKSKKTPIVYVYDGTISAYNFCIAGNGNYTTSSSYIYVYGGNITSTTDYAIYQPQPGSITVNNGIISGGAGAIYMNRGTLTINGGELISKGTGNTGDFTSGTGCAINAVIGLAAEYAEVYCNLKGGTLTANGSSKVITVGTSSSTKSIKLYVEKITIGEVTCTSYSEITSYVDLLNSNYTYDETSYTYTIAA